MIEWPFASLVVVGLIAGLFLATRWWGWLVIVLLGGVPFLAGFNAPMEGDETGPLTASLFVTPYAAAGLVGASLRALVRRFR